MFWSGGNPDPGLVVGSITIDGDLQVEGNTGNSGGGLYVSGATTVAVNGVSTFKDNISKKVCSSYSIFRW